MTFFLGVVVGLLIPYTPYILAIFLLIVAQLRGHG
jgi:hypothetical protein